jgi:hypothetical protein
MWLFLVLPAFSQELTVDFGGQVQSDIRFALNAKETGPFYDRKDAPPSIARDWLFAKGRGRVGFGKFSAKADVDLVFSGLPKQPDGLEQLADRSLIEAFHIEAHALYVEARDLLPGLDLRVGNQKVLWGVGDQFNPTNMLNPLDLQDPLLFGDRIANNMIRVDWTPPVGNQSWSLSGVVVPVFRPAQLPETASLGVAKTERLPFVSDELRYIVESEQTVARDVLGVPTVVDNIDVVLPKADIRNAQFQVRLAGMIGAQDIALSFYRGFADIPQPIANHVRYEPGQQCAASAIPGGEPVCINGLMKTDLTISYPRMDVLGLNMAGEIPLPGGVPGVGYRLEAAMNFPGAMGMELTQDALALPLIPQPAGTYPYPNGNNLVLDKRPFAKWTVGLDYSFGSKVYTNAQWVHGFADEWGAGDFFQKGYSVRSSGISVTPADALEKCVGFDGPGTGDGTQCAREVLRPRLGDYLVWGWDFKPLASGQLITRLFTILDLNGVTISEYDEDLGKRTMTHRSMFTKDGFSGVLYPEVQYNFGGGFELHGGALIYLGKEWTKFGSPEVGPSMIFTRARYSF